MEQLKLPFKESYPPHWACCDNCVNAHIYVFASHCINIEKCLYKKGKYTEIGGVFFKYYNFFVGKGT